MSIKISDVITPREETLERRIQGDMELYNMGDSSRLEGSPEKFLEITQLTDALRKILECIGIALKKGGNTSFFLAGPLGTGKSHTMVALNMIFSSPEAGSQWLKEKSFDFSVPPNCKEAWVSGAHDEPFYLWEPLLKRLGREEMTRKAPDGTLMPPGRDDILGLLEDGPVAIFIDEIEDWYSSFKEDWIRKKNKNFLQNLTEIAVEEKYRLFLFVTFLDKEFKLKQLLEDRAKPLSIDLDVDVDWNETIRYRLFKGDPDKELIEEVARKFSELSEEASFNDIRRSYPFHPEVMKILKGVWGEAQRQGIRNPLRELGNAVAEHLVDLDLILVSDLNYDLGDPENVLPSTKRRLAEMLTGDLKRCSERSGAEPILKTIFAYSLLPSHGATREQIVQGIARNSRDRDEVLISLGDVKEASEAYYIRERAGRFLISEEPSVPKMISDRFRLIPNGDASREIDSVLKREIFGEKVFLTTDDSSGVDRREFKIVISPKPMSEDEVKKLYQELKYQNRLAVISPKAGESSYDEPSLDKAKSILAARKVSDEKDVDKKEAKRELEKYSDDLKRILSERYGRIACFTEKDDIRWLEVEPNSSHIKEEVKSSILEIRRKIKELSGKEVIEVIKDFQCIRSYPMTIDDEDFFKALEESYEKGDIGLCDGNVLYHESTRSFPERKDIISPNMELVSGPEAFETIKGPEIEIEEFITPDVIEEDETANIHAKIKNMGGGGKVTGEVLINGEKIETKDVTLSHGEEKKLAFDGLNLEPGVHKVLLRVGDAEDKGKIIVGEAKEPLFYVQEFEIDRKCEKGRRVEASFTIYNKGAKGGADISLQFSDKEVDSYSVTLNSGESKHVKLSGSPKEVGKIKALLLVNREICESKTIDIKPREILEEIPIEGRTPFDIAELEENDRVSEIGIMFLDEPVGKRDLEKALESFPERVVKINVKIRRFEE